LFADHLRSFGFRLPVQIPDRFLLARPLDYPGDEEFFSLDGQRRAIAVFPALVWTDLSPDAILPESHVKQQNGLVRAES
jgi:hypothetical protein